MIELYNVNNKINEDIINQMYDILIENLFITYPHFLENKNNFWLLFIFLNIMIF